MTPYQKDPLKELITACRKAGIKVGIYYSHRQDWHEEDAAVMSNEYDWTCLLYTSDAADE